MKYILLAWAVLWLLPKGYAQLDVRLSQIPESSTGQNCYQITVENNGPKAISLAGQNYRLYYDSDALFFKEGSLSSFLSSSYTPLKLVEHHFDADASGFGLLPYENHLGFINLATDYQLPSGRPMNLDVRKPLTIAKFCFDANSAKTPRIDWATKDITKMYATAFVEISILDGDDLKRAHIVNLSVDQSGLSSTEEQVIHDISIFPNPFMDKLHINFNRPLEDHGVINVYDIFGKLVLTNYVFKGDTETFIKGTQLPEGALIIEITEANGNKSKLKAIKFSN